MSYTAPVKDMLFDIRHLAGIDEIAKIPGFEEAGFDTAQAPIAQEGWAGRIGHEARDRDDHDYAERQTKFLHFCPPTET